MALTGGLVGLLGLLIGAVAGYATRRARLCAFGAVEDAVGAGDWRRLKVFGLALAVALLATQALVVFAGFDPSASTYAQARVPWLSAAAGGLLFGFGMALVGTCAFGSLVRLGGGDMRALVTLLVYGLVALLWLRGHLALLRVDWIESVNVPAPEHTAMWRALVVGLGAVLLLGAAARDRRLLRAPRLLTAGVALGLCVAAGWLVTGVLADDFADNIRVQSLTFVAPVARALHAAVFATGEWMDFGVASVVGVPLGALAAAWRGRDFHWEAYDDPREMRRHLGGAVLMGAGGVLAGGCTIGQGLTAGSVLAPTWPLVVGGMLIGARLGIVVLVEGPVREIVSSRAHLLKRWAPLRRRG